MKGILAFSLCLFLATPAAAQPADRLERLSRGINTSHWFAQTQLTPERFSSYIAERDIRLIREMGFRHIRLSLDPDVLFDPEAPANLDPANLAILDAAVSMILAEGLAVVVDLHPKSPFKERLGEEDAFVDAVAVFWGALAAHLSQYDPDYLFLEVINEPEIADAARWQRIQEALLAAMRKGAPEHTLIATGPRWSAVPELVKLTPVDDPNVVYNLHVYDPHTFTHQGATWGYEGWRFLHGLPYPSSPELVAPAIEAVGEEGRGQVERYGAEAWNRERLEEWVRPALEWAREHGVRLTSNEFGVYRRHSPPEARLAWLRDVREVLESHGIGWAMWDYAGGFAVVNSEDGVRVPDEGTLRALGLVE